MRVRLRRAVIFGILVTFYLTLASLMFLSSGQSLGNNQVLKNNPQSTIFVSEYLGKQENILNNEENHNQSYHNMSFYFNSDHLSCSLAD